MEELVKKGHNGLQLLDELSKQAATIGHLGDRYTERYLNKNDYVTGTPKGTTEILNNLELSGSKSA
jgi:hypothetical protein